MARARRHRATTLRCVWKARCAPRWRARPCACGRESPPRRCNHRRDSRNAGRRQRFPTGSALRWWYATAFATGATSSAGISALIDAARDEIVIANAYFFPGRHFRQALMRAARRGVRVVLLVQGRVEYVLQHYASRALYGALLDAGIEIHEYRLSFLHAKVAVFDCCQASVGSTNIDPFSLLLAREANVFVEDARFAAELRARLEDAMRTGATLLPPQQWKRRPLWRRAWNWIAYGIARLLIGFAGYERYH